MITIKEIMGVGRLAIGANDLRASWQALATVATKLAVRRIGVGAVRAEDGTHLLYGRSNPTNTRKLNIIVPRATPISKPRIPAVTKSESIT